MPDILGIVTVESVFLQTEHVVTVFPLFLTVAFVTVFYGV